jgi:gluconate kinase
MIYLLFGEMGVGKNYVGERMARQLGAIFYDGDDAIPEWMWRKIRRFVPPSLVDLDRYIAEHLIPMIHNLVVNNSAYDLVVAQALYRRRHRRMIIDFMEQQKCAIIPVWLVSPSFLVHAGRLLGRERGLRWLTYCLMCKPLFQAPDESALRIVNRTGDDLSTQLRRLAGR